MKVKTSSFGPIVTFVTTGEEMAAREMLYGLTPPVIVNPQGSQVLMPLVTFGVTTAGLEGVGGWQELSPAKNGAVDDQRPCQKYTRRHSRTYRRHQRTGSRSRPSVLSSPPQ